MTVPVPDELAAHIDAVFAADMGALSDQFRDAGVPIAQALATKMLGDRGVTDEFTAGLVTTVRRGASRDHRASGKIAPPAHELQAHHPIGAGALRQGRRFGVDSGARPVGRVPFRLSFASRWRTISMYPSTAMHWATASMRSCDSSRN